MVKRGVISVPYMGVKALKSDPNIRAKIRSKIDRPDIAFHFHD